MPGTRPEQRRQREGDAAGKEGADPFTHAMASELAETARRAMHAAEEARAEHDQAAALSDRHRAEGAECQQAARRAMGEYNRACGRQADERLKLAMLEEAAEAWAEVRAAGVKEAKAADEAAEAAWRILAAGEACVRTAEVAVEMADWGRAEAPKGEQTAWASRVKSAREWMESMQELEKPRAAAAADAVAKAYRAAARARAYGAGAKSMADGFRDAIRDAKRGGGRQAE